MNHYCVKLTGSLSGEVENFKADDFDVQDGCLRLLRRGKLIEGRPYSYYEMTTITFFAPGQWMFVHLAEEAKDAKA